MSARMSDETFAECLSGVGGWPGSRTERLKAEARRARESEAVLAYALIAMIQARQAPCSCDDERLLDLPCPRHSEAEPAALARANAAIAATGESR